MLATVLSVLLFLGAGCTPASTGAPADPTGASTVSPSSTVGEPSAAAPVQRALLSLLAFHRYAFFITTWDMSQPQSPVVFQIEGVMVDPWTYLSISGPGLQEDVEVVYQGQVSRARVGGMGSWRSAAEVFGSLPALQVAPIENPEPLEELVAGIAASARGATSGAPLPPAPPEPLDTTSYEWQAPLTEGGVQMATVHNRIWLNASGMLVRWDRRLAPTSHGGQLAAIYSSIVYSRPGDAGLTIPAQGYETGGAAQTEEP